MNVLILGSGGYIGGNLIHFFKNKIHRVTGCDLLEYSTPNYNYHKVSILSPDFDAIFLKEPFDLCINASGSGNVGYSLNHPLSDFEANTAAVAKVLDTIRKYNPSCKYLHISSAAVYGNPQKMPVKEEDDLTPLSPYGFHKVMSETICKEYHELYNIDVAIIRPFSVYGNGLKKQIFWDICRKMQENKSIILFGTGKETRDFIHISDLLDLILIIAENSPFDCDTYNAASGTETSIKSIAEIFESDFPGAESVSFSGEIKKGDPINWQADIAKIKKLGFLPKANLNDSICDYINWYCNLTDEQA